MPLDAEVLLGHEERGGVGGTGLKARSECERGREPSSWGETGLEVGAGLLTVPRHHVPRRPSPPCGGTASAVPSAALLLCAWCLREGLVPVSQAESR